MKDSTTKTTTKTNGHTNKQNQWSKWMFNDKDQNQQLKYTRRHITKLQINKPVVRLHEWTHQPLNYRSTRRFEQDHGWPTDAVGAERRTTDAPRLLRTAEPRMPHGCYAQQNHGWPTDALRLLTTDDPRMLTRRTTDQTTIRRQLQHIRQPRQPKP